MKTRIITILSCALALFFALSGCQLAREDAGAGQEDRFIGVFLTTEYLDLFDLEAYFTNNIGDIFNDKIIEGDTQKYQDRIYATPVENEYTDEETGEKITTTEYVFEGISGIAYFAPTVPATDAFERYHTTMSDLAICDSSIHHNISDNANSISMEGSIYIAVGKEAEFYFNSVYQSADGRVYLLSEGGGFMISGDIDSEGDIYAQTMESEYTTTENGITKTSSVSVEVSIRTMFAPKRICIIQMNAESQVIAQEEYAADAMPHTFFPDADTEYIVVETYKSDEEGGLFVTRELYGTDAELMQSFFAREDGICIKQDTQIMWEE